MIEWIYNNELALLKLLSERMLKLENADKNNESDGEQYE